MRRYAPGAQLRGDHRRVPGADDPGALAIGVNLTVARALLSGCRRWAVLGA
ncbi:hypothetical protein ACWEN3_36860 [Streptomyces sp. NPDC004561]